LKICEKRVRLNIAWLSYCCLIYSITGHVNICKRWQWYDLNNTIGFCRLYFFYLSTNIDENVLLPTVAYRFPLDKLKKHDWILVQFYTNRNKSVTEWHDCQVVFIRTCLNFQNWLFWKVKTKSQIFYSFFKLNNLLKSEQSFPFCSCTNYTFYIPDSTQYL